VSRRVLLLQGPVGPFFGDFARDLENRGYFVCKINFNGGDAFCYKGPNPIEFTGSSGEFPDFLRETIEKHGVERLYLFGDTRKHHEQAISVSREMGVRAFVFEEGYIRPDFITLEEWGVNARSDQPRDPAYFRRRPQPVARQCQKTAHVFVWTAIWAMVYYTASAMARKKYPHYHHHRPLGVLSETSRWFKGFIRKFWYGIKERKMLNHLVTEHSKKFFLVPLQVHCDGQVRHHSSFDSVFAFIEKVVESFAGHASESSVLVIKHHPLDRAYNEYTASIKMLERKYNLAGRLFYVHDLHLPTLLDHAAGTVVINSTVGLSSLWHGAPVKVLGEAVYNMPGLTSQLDLDKFWLHPGLVDTKLNAAYRAYLMETNQLNGSFYNRLSESNTVCGLKLDESFWKRHLSPSPEVLDQKTAVRARKLAT